MSFQDRPSYQRPTKSSSSPSVTPVGRNSGSVPLVRGLSPVRNPYYGRAQELETQRSHDNPLFRNHASDPVCERRPGRAVTDNDSTKTMKNSKENGDTEEPWKVHVEKGQFGGKPTCATPGKTSRVAAMQFTTPPKPFVKRKILSENNRDVGKPLSSSTPRRGEESLVDAASTVGQEGSRNETERRFSETSSDESDEQQAPMVSIEELQTRIQRFLQKEPTLETPVSPVQSTESSTRYSSVVCGASPEPSVEDVVAFYHPVFSPYSPRPEFLRARTRSPSPAAMEIEEEESLTHDPSPIPTLEKSTTPTSYDPKNNFLSPRPQFLRYRPLRRLELLRRSAEALLNLDSDSPATDSPADSVKVDSEAGVTESQEIQSPTSEVLTPPTQDAEEDAVGSKSGESQLQLGECRCELKTEFLSESIVFPSETSEISVNDSSQVGSVGAQNGNTEHSEGELDIEVAELSEAEHIRSLPRRVFRTSVCLIGAIGFLLFVLATSGSTGILPESLHQNELSIFWRTSEHAAPVRKLLQSVEGLWKESPGAPGYPVNRRYMETLRTNLGEVGKAVTTLSSQGAFNAVMELSSLSVPYIASFSSHIARTYSNVKKRLLVAADSYISRAPDIDEWDWVSEYDFVVAKDIFDWTEAYEAILAKIESWEVKSIFKSHIDSKGAKCIHELIEESSLENNLDVVESIVSEARAASLDIQLVQYDSNLPVVRSESANNQFTHAPDEESASREAEQQILLESLDKENKEEFFGSPSPASDGIVEHTTVSSPVGTEVVEPHRAILDQDGSSASAGEGLALSDSRVDEHEEGTVTSLFSIESEVDMFTPSDTVEPTHAERIQHARQQQSQEALSGAVEITNLPANPFALRPEDTSPQGSIPKNTMVFDVQPNLSSSSLLGFWPAMTPAILAAAVVSVLLAAVVAMILLRPARRNSSRVLRTVRDDAWNRKSSVDANTGQVTKGKLARKPQRTFKTMSKSQAVDTGSNYLPDDSPVPARIASEYTEYFSTPSLILEKAHGKPVTDRNSFLTPERPVKPATDRNSFLSPERASKQISDAFRTPEVEVLEDASLGRFTTLVPVVHNEGTEKEEVKLTPVRRSSRIRSRLQSPCSSTLSHFSYSPEL